MSRFKIKDLMIDVVTFEEQLPQKVGWYTCLPFRTCHFYVTPPTCRWYITPPTCRWYLTPPGCHPYLSPWVEREIQVCPAGSEPPFDPGELVQFDPRALDVLRKQLQVEMEQVEAAAQRIATEMAPQTIEEVDMLETKLQEAMEELKTVRRNIKK